MPLFGTAGECLRTELRRRVVSAQSCENGYNMAERHMRAPGALLLDSPKILANQRFNMIRHIRIRESDSGLDARVLLLDERAPRSAEVFWQIAGAGGLHEAIHAM